MTPQPWLRSKYLTRPWDGTWLRWCTTCRREMKADRFFSCPVCGNLTLIAPPPRLSKTPPPTPTGEALP